MGGIRRALDRRGFPGYLKKIIGSYLSDRRITWEGRDGKRYCRKVERGVPQGSALGPLLWNIAYDSVLKMSTPANCEVICYADETLVVVGGRSIEEAMDRASITTNMIARKLKWMGLQVAGKKTEAIRFRRNGERRVKREKVVSIENTRVKLGTSLNYLGMTVRDDWSVRTT